MAGFYVHTVKACLYRKRSGCGIFFGKRIQIVVGHDILVGDGTRFLIDRVTVGDHGDDALSARMGKLQNEDLLRPGFLLRQRPHLLEKCLELWQILLCQHHLARVGPSLGADRACLKPHHCRAAFRRAYVFFDRQLTRTSVRVAITALHWLKHHAIVKRYRSYLNG